jgi:hypothetical protein
MSANVSTEIKKLVYANPDAKAQEIFDQLTAAGIKTSLASVSAFRSDFLNSIAVLKELGAFNKAPVVAKPKVKKVKTPSRPDRWAAACSAALDAISELEDLKSEYEEWQNNLPDSLQSSPVGEKLQAVCDIDLDSARSAIEEAENAELPLGFGKD